jgi:hypothetical protein
VIIIFNDASEVEEYRRAPKKQGEGGEIDCEERNIKLMLI